MKTPPPQIAKVPTCLEGTALKMNFSLDLDPNSQGEDLMIKLNESVDEALLMKPSLTKSKKWPMQVGVRDASELCKDFPFLEKVSLKMYWNTLGLINKKKEETFHNPNTESEKSDMKGRDVIPPESIFQPGNFDASTFAEQVLECSYEILRTKKVKKMWWMKSWIWAQNPVHPTEMRYNPNWIN